MEQIEVLKGGTNACLQKCLVGSPFPSLYFPIPIRLHPFTSSSFHFSSIYSTIIRFSFPSLSLPFTSPSFHFHYPSLPHPFTSTYIDFPIISTSPSLQLPILSLPYPFTSTPLPHTFISTP